MRGLRSKKGVMFFAVDALIAGAILTLTVVLLLSFVLNTPRSIDATYYVNGYVDYITNTKMSEFNGDYKFIYNDVNETNPDIDVYQKILIMRSKKINTTSFIENFTSIVLPEHVGVKYEIDGATIYSRLENRVDEADILLTNSLLTFVVDENNVIYGPNITKVTIWV
jgi:hypothetical protein